MQFLIDMPLSPALARWLVEEGHDAVHASALGMSCASDCDIIERANREHRIIITADLDYPRLLALAEASSPSLILFRGGAWSESDVIERTGQVLPVAASLGPAGFILVVDRDRVRLRRLPISQDDG